jgi:hypothetical protein
VSLGGVLFNISLADPTADGADDEKRIKKAAKSAAAELKAAQDKKKASTVVTYS